MGKLVSPLTQGRVRAAFCLFCALCLSGPLRVSAQSVPGEACYARTCYPSFREAEAALRADGLWGSKYVRGITRGSPPGSVDIQFVVPLQEPEKFYAPVYFINNDTPQCASQMSDSCPDEATVMASIVADVQYYYRDQEIVNAAWIGHFLEPFYYVGRAGGYDGRVGRISYTKYDEMKRYAFTVHWPGTPTSYDHYEERPMAKYQSYLCPLGSVSVDGYSTAHPFPGSTSPTIDWPKFCAVEGERWITYLPKPPPPKGLGPCDGNCGATTGQ